MSRNETDALIEENNAELEALRRDMAERQRRDKSAEMLEWARARAEAKAEAPAPAAEQPKRDAKMTNTEAWQSWIDDRIRASQRKAETAMIGGVADMFAKEAKVRRELEIQLATIHAELAKLRTELAELRGEARMRGALEDMQSRLARLEATPARLKTVS